MTAAELCNAIVQWATGRPDVMAVVLVGSHARGTATSSSDVDFVLLVENPTVFFEDRAWTKRFGEVLSCSCEEYGEVVSLRVWYAGGMEVEFGFARAGWIQQPLDKGTREVLEQGAVLLFEHDGVISASLSQDGDIRLRNIFT